MRTRLLLIFHLTDSGVVDLLCDLLLMDKVVDEFNSGYRAVGCPPRGKRSCDRSGSQGFRLSLLNGKEPGHFPLQVGRHGDLLVADGEMHQTPLESEQRLSRLPSRPILLFCICENLTGETVFSVPSLPAATR